MSGESSWFVGDAMAAVVQGAGEVETLLGQAPVIVGGLAVMCRLTTPYRATTDLDIVDRLEGDAPHLEVLRSAVGAEPVEPAAVLLPTRFGQVRVDVLEVRDVELRHPSSDPGDRLHASSHAWALDTATELTIRAESRAGENVRVTARVAEPGPLVAMKLQAVMDRGAPKQGTDLQDIVRLTLDPIARGHLLDQIAGCEPQMADDMAQHVSHWLVRQRLQAARWIQASGGADLSIDDVDLVAELLLAACSHRPDLGRSGPVPGVT